ncbi:PKD domain-containing protein [Marmoricola sp. URHB0036]|uniref:PKD domain-containing protein n=1 Tax=Marmoricola sp. URHB0036 TaxID=1298863 RepID=UPI0004121485|nr:PKD domain-containing protein [Marmoricola sp. URHB0036]
MTVPTAPARGRRRLATLLTTTVVGALALAALGPLPGANAALPAPTLSYVGAASAAGSTTSHVVKVPATVVAGDTMLLFTIANTKSGTMTGPAGWTQLQSRDGSASRARVWTRKATATDRGTNVTVRTSVKALTSTSVVVYRSSRATSAVTASASATLATAGTSHTAPAVAVSQPGSFLVSYWGGKASVASLWTPPANAVQRTGVAGGGTNHTTAIVADSKTPVPTGTAAARVAKSAKALTSNQLMSVVVSPGPAPANRAPVAAFTSSCAVLACSFDSTGSSDPDGDALTYAWTYGDNATGTGATSSHSYARTGTRNVTLTVNDGTTSISITKPVTATYAEPLPGHTRLVSEAPEVGLPKFLDGDGTPAEIHDIEVVGDRVFVVGSFATVANDVRANGATPANTTSYNQPHIAAYDLGTGLVDPTFNPVFDGNSGFDVDAVEASPDGTRLYVSGSFNTVNGVTKKGIAEIDPDNGDTVPGFTADADSRVTELAVSGTTVYAGGRFGKINGVVRKSLAAVDALTGVVDTGFVNNLSGGIGVNGGLTVQKLLLTHDGSKLLVIHTGRQINGQDRYGIGIIDTATKQLTPWRTRLWDDNLQFVGGIQRIISGSIAPDDSWFVVSSGSGGDRPPINDTVVAYPMTGGNDVQPKWISRCFDSVYSTAISEKAVYIGGHFAWNESPSAPLPFPGAADVGYGTGQGFSGYGLGDSVVGREHLGALNPVDGHALEWNPGSNSNIGNEAMALTPHGLLTGGDATTQGSSNVGSVAYFDLDNVDAPGGVDTTITTPISGRVLTTAQNFTITGTATAPTGVRKVFLEVQDRDSLQWLQPNKTDWGPAANFEATVTPVDATTATWSVTLNVPRNVKMLVRAKAQGFGPNNTKGDEDPTKAIKKIETWSPDDAPPTMAYAAVPAAGLVNSKTFTVSGTAADDHGVTGITMTLRDSAGRYLQDDGTSDPTYNTIRITPDVPNATSTTWSKEITVPTEGTWQAQSLAHDTAGNASLDTLDRTWVISANGQAPSVSISSPGSVVPPTTPQPVTVAPGGPMTFSGTATDDGTIKAVYVAMLNNSTGENLTVDGTWGIDNGLALYKLPVTPNVQSYHWTWTTPQDLGPGNYTFAVLATDNEDITTPQSSWALMTLNAVVPGDAPPKATLSATGTQPPSGALHLGVITGQATDDQGVAAVRLIVKDMDTSRYLKEDGTVSSTFATVPADVANVGATSTPWSTDLTLPTQGSWNVTAYAVDAAGQRDLATTNAVARYPIYPGDSAPTLTDSLLAPTENASFTEGKILVSGRSEDDQSTSKVEVAIIDGTGKFLTSTGTFGVAESWRAAFLTSPGTPGSNFSYTTPVLPEGSYTVKVRATDQHGLVTVTPPVRHVTVTIPAGNAAPVAVLKKSCTENVCAFDAKDSTDENAPTLTYTWNYGAGQGTGTGPNPTKTYTAAGTYTVTLTAKDEWGVSSAPATTTVTITEPAGNTAPAPVIQAPSCNGLACNFSAVGTTDNLGDAITYAWNFGDTASNTATGSATSHVFSGPGTYTVTLTTTDGWGKTASVTKDVTFAP